MANYGSNQVSFILLNGYSLAGITELKDDGVEQLTQRMTSMGDSWDRHQDLGIAKSNGIQHVGFYDDAALALNEALLASTARVVTSLFAYAFQGGTVGTKFVGWQGALQGKLARIFSLGQLTVASGTYTPSGKEDGEGVILADLISRSATTANGTGVDGTAATTTGGAGYVFLTAISGFTSVTPKVQHSTDNSTFTDLITFTAITAKGAQRIETAAATTTVNRYLRSTYTTAGAGSFTAMIGFARGQGG